MYLGELTQLDIKYAYELLIKAGSSYRLKSNEYRGNLQPYLYFDGSAKVGFKVLLTNNRWPFNKGMQICVWFKALGGVKPSSSQSTSPKKRETLINESYRSIILQLRTE